MLKCGYTSEKSPFYPLFLSTRFARHCLRPGPRVAQIRRWLSVISRRDPGLRPPFTSRRVLYFLKPLTFVTRRVTSTVADSFSRPTGEPAGPTRRFPRSDILFLPPSTSRGQPDWEISESAPSTLFLLLFVRLFVYLAHGTGLLFFFYMG